MGKQSTIGPIVFLLGLPATASPCIAWGGAGHRIVAEIATAFLTPQAGSMVHDLLGEATLPQVSTWADEIKSDPTYDWASPLHYANVREGEKSFDLDRDCPQARCVVGAILRYAEVLRDRSAAPETRRKALKFLVHFVADVHQPLHVSRAADRGGNLVLVRWRDRTVDLHSLWDTELLETAAPDWKQHAAMLLKSITPEQVAGWNTTPAPSTQIAVTAPAHDRERIAQVSHWATESYRLAIRYAYAVPQDNRIDDAYAARSLPVIDRRLSMAGARLAALLNAMAAPDSPSPTTRPATCSAPALSP